jgi:hypothetical protein
MAACQTRKRERGEALEAADGDVVANGVVSKTFGEAVFCSGTGNRLPESLFSQSRSCGCVRL